MSNADLVATQDVILSFAALLFEIIVERCPAWKVRYGHHKVAAGISNEPFDLAFVVPLAGAAIPISDHIMRQHRTEPLCSLAFAIRHNLGGTAPKKANACTCPSNQASVFAAGYART